MRISELVERTGVPLATLKYYLREGLLPSGEATSATRAAYGETHVRRVAVIRALTETVGLSVQKTRDVLQLIDHPEEDLVGMLGKAIEALPPNVTPDARADYPRARAVLEKLGQVYEPRFAAVAQLEHALAAAEAAGIPLDDERLAVYGPHIRAIAEFDVRNVPREPAAAVEYAVLGTAVHEPVLVALRRLAHQDLASRRLGPGRDATKSPRGKPPKAPSATKGRSWKKD
ncbi:MerR family transcriptional regulator [Myxococcus sp. K15C18031901]|uniref:MerR family transcriptional regulator n=1 Tax=Myxococcus dinghuensis TaxID=2906761 RepID=UPI0020A77FC8|nr:MerR family transcriptional regulator [Myxococcus dinghuensis]MCP3098019.1 MerR family transcriptional regulator [Myxococcus dinghuensis]